LHGKSASDPSPDYGYRHARLSGYLPDTLDVACGLFFKTIAGGRNERACLTISMTPRSSSPRVNKGAGFHAEGVKWNSQGHRPWIDHKKTRLALNGRNKRPHVAADETFRVFSARISNLSDLGCWPRLLHLAPLALSASKKHGWYKRLNLCSSK